MTDLMQRFTDSILIDNQRPTETFGVYLLRSICFLELVAVVSSENQSKIIVKKNVTKIKLVKQKC